MPYCVAYGCKSKLFKGCGIHFFKIPKDKPRRKRWIHYCKLADFTQASLASTLCSKHFSSQQYERVPLQLAKFGYKNARPRLKPDAVLDIPISRLFIYVKTIDFHLVHHKGCCERKPDFVAHEQLRCRPAWST